VQIERIEGLDDLRVADYRNIRDAELPGRGGLFMAEGRLVARALLERGSGYRARSVFVTDAGLESLWDLLESAEAGPRVFVAEQRVFNEIAGFNVHRGCLAVGERGEGLEARAMLAGLGGSAAMVVGVENVSNHDNMGGIFRNALAFGAGCVVMCPRCCDPLYRKSIRVSMGAALRVPFARSAGTGAMLEAFEEGGFTTMALTPRVDAEEIGEVARRLGEGRRVALLVGAEGPGLSEEALVGVRRRVRIGMAAGVDSLNVSVAAGIAMHRLGAPARDEVDSRA